ncbi:MAG: hypothetical protein K6E91_00945 [Butyrivibrio sp.]|nr:hypothetical protein [Butyrivibrio sp.]
MGDNYFNSLGEIMGNLEADLKVIEGMIDSVTNDLANQKLKDAAKEIRSALSEMSDEMVSAQAS